MLTAAGFLALGGLLLYFGAEWLVKGSAGLARSFGIPPLVVGLTVVAYGTSTPELVVSTLGALQGKGELTLGNVIGSNIANIGLILGLSALVRPLEVAGSLIRRELPVLFATTLLLVGLLADGVVSRWDGVLLLVGAFGFTALTLAPSLRDAGRNVAIVEEDAELAGAPPLHGRPRLAAISAAGLIMLVGGGKLFVDGAVELARGLGASERVVGLTVVAVGTSLPELAASIIATLRGHSSIAIGNVIGSNIFNVVFVLGGAALLRPIPGDILASRFDLIALSVLTVTAIVMLRKARQVSRVEGATLIFAYGVFVAFTAAG